MVGVAQNGVSESLEGGNPRSLMGANLPLVDKPLVGVEVNLRPRRQFYLVYFLDFFLFFLIVLLFH